MNESVLIFPDTWKMAQFLLETEISNVIANSLEQSISGKLDEDDILIACSKYDAVLKTMPFDLSFDS